MKHLIRILILLFLLPLFISEVSAQEREPNPEHPSVLVQNTTNVAIAVYVYNGKNKFGPAVVGPRTKRCLVMDIDREKKLQFGLMHKGAPEFVVWSLYPFLMPDRTGWSLIVRDHGFEIYDLMNIKPASQCHVEQGAA